MTNKEKLETILDEHFPKGDAARGRALILFAHAVAFMEERPHIEAHESLKERINLKE